MHEQDRWANGPVSSDEILERQARTRQIANQEGFAALMVIGRAFYDRPGSLAYLSNHFPPFPSSVFTGTAQGMGHGVLVLPAEGPTTLLTDGAGVRQDIVVADDVISDMNIVGALIDYLKTHRLDSGAVGLVGSDIIPLAWYNQLTRHLPQLMLIPSDAIVERQRQIKSETEIDRLREAAAISAVGLSGAFNAIREGATELEVCANGTGAALWSGADFVRYLRVHSGEWAVGGARWPQATDRRLETGDLINVDIIGAHRGYGFDVLRTGVVGRPNDAQHRLLNAALAATNAAVEAAQPGASTADVIAAAGRVAEQAGYTLSGFLGHAIGIETMESPFIRIEEPPEQLEAGMVLCIEPGLRADGIGWASVEQEIVVREGGPELLTLSPAQTW